MKRIRNSKFSFLDFFE